MVLGIEDPVMNTEDKNLSFRSLHSQGGGIKIYSMFDDVPWKRLNPEIGISSVEKEGEGQ